MGAVTLIACVFLYVRVWKTDEQEQKKKRGNHNSILLFFFLNGLFHQTDCMFEQIAGGGCDENKLSGVDDPGEHVRIRVADLFWLPEVSWLLMRLICMWKDALSCFQQEIYL